jgi:hypothetical protein
MTDRFNNGDPSNDLNFGRDKTGKLRGFEDIKGISKKLMRDILINWNKCYWFYNC